jgi:hypothetical protein
MLRIIRIVFLLSMIAFVAVCGCVKKTPDVQPEVKDFIQLLIKADKPTLAEYERFSGDGDPSELELEFELKECHAKGWADRSKECINYENSRWKSADRQPALFLGWLRERFSTVGKSYKIISVESKTEGFNHELIEVEIGNNRFLLFHNTAPDLPTGELLSVTKVNGKEITDYLK